MTILIAALASTNQPPNLVLFIAFLIGVLLFILGFKTYREYRVLAETAGDSGSQYSYGVSAGAGTATGDDRLTSPLTGVPCFYYRVQTRKVGEEGERERQMGEGRH